MKPPIRTLIISIVISIGLFILGSYLWGDIMKLILPTVKNVPYIETELTSQFRMALLFSLTLALIPIATILIWKFAPVLKTKRKVLTVGIIILTMTVSVLARREIIKSRAKRVYQLAQNDISDPLNTILPGIPVNTLNFELYAFAGLIAGGVISFFTLREKPLG